MVDPWAAFAAKVDAAVGSGAGAQAATGPTAANSLGGNFLAGGKAPMVYWGQQSHVNTSGRDQEARDDAGYTRARWIKGHGVEDRTVPLQNAVADWYSWSDAERQAFGQKVYKLGMISNPNDYQQAYAAWANAVQEASNFYTASNGTKKMTPWQAVDLMGAIGGGASKTSTNTSKSFNIPTVEDAHAVTRQLFQALMGRDPQGDELDRYASMMTAYAQKHPTVTKSTQTTDIHGNTTSSSTSSGGYTAQGLQDMAAQRAKQDPEYGSYQAAVPLWNALMSAIGGTGG